LIANKRAHEQMCRDLILEEDFINKNNKDELNRAKKAKELFDLHKDVMIIPLHDSFEE